ncbi:class I SAM-dependent methyltransferase [Sphingomonas sp.]|uniref:class I SAM-dependent methyltransferase n=1 Tax=Sphingomonas sp. TaxID=28214 RepID=UPI00181E81CF|nr:class I SAM-dependent methyltransferase [Sphingomonas sp.]MBA3511528.1 class I SAM-dependent methyltransferase [Sphingomonas sp.]
MDSPPPLGVNIDQKTVEGFGEEWSSYDQQDLDQAEHLLLFEQYFSTFPFESLPATAEGFDLGCGSGRWAALVAPRVARLHCIDPSAKALEVCRRRLSQAPNVSFHLAGADTIPLDDLSQDFGYSLGVLHHIPDTSRAMRDAVGKLKFDAPFLVYLYYNFDNRPRWFRALWLVSELGRKTISRTPFRMRKFLTTAIAALIYWPLSRSATLLKRLGLDVSSFPLSGYRYRSFYSLRTDALDRFGTPLEQRFSRAEIQAMMEAAGLVDITFREDEPFWVACGRKAGPTRR